MTDTDPNTSDRPTDSSNTGSHPIQTPIALDENKTTIEFVHDVLAAIQGPTADREETQLRLYQLELTFVDRNGEEYVYTREADDVDFSVVNNLEPIELPLTGVAEAANATDAEDNSPMTTHSPDEEPATEPDTNELPTEGAPSQKLEATGTPDTVPTKTPDATLELTDNGIEMPNFLRGYTGEFTVRTPNVTGIFETSDGGLPEKPVANTMFAILPEDGDYHSDLEGSVMAIKTDTAPETVFKVVDARGETNE